MSNADEIFDMVDQLPSLLQYRLTQLYELSTNTTYTLEHVKLEQEKALQRLQQLQLNEDLTDEVLELELQDLKQTHNSALLAADMREKITSELLTVVQRNMRRFDDIVADYMQEMDCRYGEFSKSVTQRVERMSNETTAEGQNLLHMISVLAQVDNADPADKAKEVVVQTQPVAKNGETKGSRKQNNAQRRTMRKMKIKQEPLDDTATNGATARKFRRRQEAAIYCSCRGVAYGKMIACDNSKCKNEWYHYDCIGLKTPPAGAWYCAGCSKNSNRLPPVKDDDDSMEELDVIGIPEDDSMPQAQAMFFN